MNKEIAVFLDEKDKTQSLLEPGVVKVFGKLGEEWKALRSFPFHVNAAGGVREIRDSLGEMARSLGDCRIVIAREVSGLAYNVLDASGFDIFEIVGAPGQMLDYVVEQLEEEKLRQAEAAAEIARVSEPMETETPGCFKMDLKAYQNCNPEASTKKALLPFLMNRTFYQLEVLCGHIPPWFGTRLEELNMAMETTQLSRTEHLVTIRPKTCYEKKEG